MKKPFAITLDVGSSLANHTGSWRTLRPEYVSRLPPCNHACPAGENTQKWLYHAEEGDYRAAWEEIMADNPFPAIMGRACYHPCETDCNRGKTDQPVAIHAVERFLGDLAIQEGWTVEASAPPTGKRVLVIGAGPSGLSAAYHLRRMGHAVTLRDAGPKPGGMMRFGIPKYRLPRQVIDAEIERILAMGVGLELDCRVDDVQKAMQDGQFDACFVAIGAHLAKRVDIPAVDAARVMDAVSLLRRLETGGESPRLGRRVAIYGGGDTAIDVARTAARLGAESILIYRRTPERMPAHPSEVMEAREEGVLIRWLSTITQLDKGIVTVEKMVLGDDGLPKPTGEFETIEADTLVLALGQDVDLSILEHVPGVRIEDGAVLVDPHLMTGHPGLFAGGDMVFAERTITTAVGHGKKAARNIDAYVRGTQYHPLPKHELATFEHLNTWYYTDADRTVQPTLDAVRRRTTFEEVHGGLDASNAMFEARRCLSCGNCFECDNCFGMCPDNAVIKLGQGKGFRFNFDFCKGCGLCAQECPCGAIRMVPEEI
jgi:2-oxoacid:acceptor oxidoreductase delta subunit (pyruvate/2-ketoisovalerate family)